MFGLSLNPVLLRPRRRVRRRVFGGFMNIVVALVCLVAGFFLCFTVFEKFEDWSVS